MRQIQLTLEQKDRFVVGIALLVIFLVAFILYLKNRTPDIVNYPTERTAIIAFGDSLVGGVGSDDGLGFIPRLEDLINREITQYGFPGYTTTDGLEIIDEIAELEAGVVILSLGGNDRIQRVEEERVFKNMSKIISKLQNAGSIVVLIETPGYGKLYRELAHEHKAVVVPRALSSLMRNPKYMSDLIHPNTLGYGKMAERIAPEVRRILR